ncbi:MAG: efflux RND transporter periplasmic adaptor subunit [Deltaproteobacteria bacterium]|nr:MAG: efflux RND transporter periplasmic adaptor subunit [Deltaproteobacteria bacterium]
MNDHDDRREASQEPDARPSPDAAAAAVGEHPASEGDPVTSVPTSSKWRRHLGRWWGVALAVAFGFAIGRCVPPGGASGDATGEPGAKGRAASDAGSAETVWTCSMHPQIRMSEPGKCPICGMDLIPVASGGGGGTAEDAIVQLSPEARGLAAVRTVPVRRLSAQAELRLLGRVEVDETRLRAVTPWFGGRIDRLRVRETGTRVRRGQVVADVYSPEVYAALLDLSVAARTRAVGGDEAMATATERAAREKLRLLGVDTALVERVAAGEKVPEHVPVRARAGGTVLRRNVEQGDYVEPKTALFDIADLSVVWIQLEAYEDDLPRVRLGANVVFEPEGVETPYSGKVVFIDPVVDPRRRIARVRVEVQNTDGRLRPGMFGRAVVASAQSDDVLVVPRSAVLFTGRRSVAYVERAGEPGTFELRTLRVGPATGDLVPVLAGLGEGERVVAKGAFFLDADLQLRGGRSMMTLPDDRSYAARPRLVVPAAALDALRPVVASYMTAASALARDDLGGAKKALAELAAAVVEVDLPAPQATKDAFARIASELTGHLAMADTAEDLPWVRRAFEMLAEPMVELLTDFGNPTDEKLVVVTCPMAFDAKGARWVQPEGKVENPYFGPKMLRCGNVDAKVAPGERLPPSASRPETPPAAAPVGHHHGG